MEIQAIGKYLILVGALIVVVGILVVFFNKIPIIGKLPGDINIKKDNFQIFIPITTSILLSLIITAVIWLWSFFTKK